MNFRITKIWNKQAVLSPTCFQMKASKNSPLSKTRTTPTKCDINVFFLVSRRSWRTKQATHLPCCELDKLFSSVYINVSPLHPKKPRQNRLLENYLEIPGRQQDKDKHPKRLETCEVITKRNSGKKVNKTIPMSTLFCPNLVLHPQY